LKTIELWGSTNQIALLAQETILNFGSTPKSQIPVRCTKDKMFFIWPSSFLFDQVVSEKKVLTYKDTDNNEKQVVTIAHMFFWNQGS